MIAINGIEKEDLIQWRDNAITKKVMETVRIARQEFAQAAINGHYLGNELEYARAVGVMWAFEQLLNISHEEEDQK